MKFHMPTEILFGPGMIRELGKILEQKRFSRPLLVTDGGVEAAGIARQVLRHVVPVAVFNEVEANPKQATVDRAGGLARTLRPDLIIGLGGGSVLDAAKAIALLGTNPGRIEDYEGREKYREAPLPVLAIPTTCGTGSEVTWVSIITHTGRRAKMSIKGPLMYPAVALVDPDLLITLPSHLVASTGFDALTHAIEAYTAKPATVFTDMLAGEALRLIFRSLPEAFPEIGRNSTARDELMLGSVLAAMAFVNSDVGAVHCLAESIGGLYDTPHGVANAVLLPFVMEFNLEAAEAKYARVAAQAGIESSGEKEAAARLILKVQVLSRELRIPKFKDLGIPEKDFKLIAQKSFENNSNPSNAREATAADYLAILRRASRAVR